MFISFEGGDGCGKSTQIARLAQFLEDHGHTVVVTREPGGTPLGQHIRQLLLHGDDMGPRAEALLYAADRSHHVETVIRPALERGETVLTDRFFDSSLAYQGAARSLGLDDVRDINVWATSGLIPDKTFLLDLDPVIGMSRLTGEPDRLEKAGSDFHTRVRQQFLELAAREPERFEIVDASNDMDAVTAHIHAVIKDML